MPRSTQVLLGSISVSDTGLSPSTARLSSRLLLPNHESHIGVLQPRMDVSTRFGLFPVRSPLLRESLLISFPLVTEMFHFTRSAPISLCIQLNGDGTLLPTGFPIQKSSDQRIFGSSPRLIAAYHVFHRLSAPRHPPVALINLFSLELPSLSLFNCKRTTTTYRRCRDFSRINPAITIAKSHGQSPINAGENSSIGGGGGNRTHDIQLAKLALSQLSYTPIRAHSRL